MTELESKSRQNYGYFVPISTRWMDNDVYGHINNVTYYSYFDTAANSYLIDTAGLDIHQGDVIGFVVASSCQYHSPIAFPDSIEAGVRVNKIGHSSVEYGIAIFKQDHEQASAAGKFTHVFVERATGQPVQIPVPVKNALVEIHIESFR